MLKKHILLAAFAMTALAGQAIERADYWRSDSVKVMRLLKQAAKQDSNTNYALYFARQLRDLPYVGKTLEKNSDERLVVNLRQLDCTTYTETVMALTLCMKQKKPSFDNFCRNLRLLRYKDGVVSYANRLHYFTSWIEENTKKGLVDCIEEPSAAFSATQTVNANYMTTHTRLYPMLVKNPEWISLIRDTEKEISGRKHKYIPKSRLNDSALLRQAIHDGDIIVILTSKQGLDTSHIGIAVWHADGLHLLNASQVRKKVVEEPKTFFQYMREHASHTGIRVVRLR